jgi:hypothetical protein
VVPKCFLSVGNLSILQGIANLVVLVFLRLRIRRLPLSRNGMSSATEFLGRLVLIMICGTVIGAGGVYRGRSNCAEYSDIQQAIYG